MLAFRSKPWCFVAAITVMLLSPAADAGVISQTYSGTVTAYFDSAGYFGGNVAVGDTVTGSVVYPDSGTDFDPSPNRAVYAPTPPDFGIVMQVHGAGGTLVWATGPSAFTTQIFVHDDYFGMDQFYMQQYQSYTDCGPAPVSGSTCLMTFELRDETPPLDLLSSDALPATLDVAKAQAFAGSFLLSYKQFYNPETQSSQEQDDYWILFSLQSVGGPAASIAEPSTLALSCCGFGAWLALRRRRQPGSAQQVA